MLVIVEGYGSTQSYHGNVVVNRRVAKFGVRGEVLHIEVLRIRIVVVGVEFQVPEARDVH